MPAKMKTIAILIIKYLKGQLEGSNLGPDATEGVEVAVQCLENAYGVTSEDIQNCGENLEEMYQSSLHSPQHGRVVTEEQKAQAEGLKAQGNILMKENKHGEAVGRYTSAIELDPRNPVYFCNRAAAHIQMQNYLAAINDCHEAIRLDAQYSKAYSRLGYAYQAIGNRSKAKDCYAKAMEIEPDNESYRNCYQKLADEGPSTSRPVTELMGMLPNIDLSAIMKNPSFVQMASQMLEDPGMQNAVTRILSGQSSFPAQQVEELISAGQQLADRLQSQMEGPQQQGGASTSQPVAQPATSSASASSASSAPPPRHNRPRGPVLSAEERYDSVGPGGEAPSAMAYNAMRRRHGDDSEGEDSTDQ
ncbi:small glutamine-rich tetratricopeptide repeat-containing protein alpha-like isoform X2 [Ischnura elegans]|uniref:small glutamine-rich tetratricopeptide repeat-containing protein alpha-like isoform X2 n=1 Tax=Ischnura elegans TaxID=197161 RepID=UPI001ED8B2DB|nr:small glutamine-rich tetratricopeptide repeat-containing protein alpha-like isoform X2 [Ischnura elegans]XP_046405350.1 small glutamine-rich tetratricopeptide repeat-containing protein alpha-like isoform X2 [Ischnura elegans]